MTEILTRLKVEPIVSDGRYSCYFGMYKLTPEGLLHQATSTEQSFKFWIYS